MTRCCSKVQYVFSVQCTLKRLFILKRNIIFQNFVKLSEFFFTKQLQYNVIWCPYLRAGVSPPCFVKLIEMQADVVPTIFCWQRVKHTKEVSEFNTCTIALFFYPFFFWCIQVIAIVWMFSTHSSPPAANCRYSINVKVRRIDGILKSNEMLYTGLQSVCNMLPN